MGFRSDGIAGYVGKKNLFKRKRQRGKGFKRRNRFRKRVTRIINNNSHQKMVLSVLSSTRLALAVGACEGLQSYTVLAIKNSGGDVAQCVGNINAALGITNTNLASYWLHAYNLSIAMKNQEQCNSIIDIYELIPRVATTTSAVTTLAAESKASAGADQSTDWGYTPFQAVGFCQQFKILRKTRYMLAPGASEIIDIRESRKMCIESSKYFAINDVTATGSQLVPQFSKLWMAFVRGEPVNASVVKTNVSTSTFAVDFVMREDYHYSYDPNDQNPRAAHVVGLPALADENTVLIDTGAIINPPVAA